MSLSSQLAKHIRELHSGGNWTSVNLNDSLQGIDRQQALKQVLDFNTIAALVYHINYYFKAQIRVLEGKELSASDKFSFDHPEFATEEEWRQFISDCLSDAGHYASLVESLPDERLWEPFVDGKYGHYYRNIQGAIEHAHYHLGQIVLVKKAMKAVHSS